MQPAEHPSRIVRLGILLGAWTVSILAYIFLRTVFGIYAGALAVIPMVLAAYYWGTWRGLAAAAAILLLNVGLAYWFGYTTREIFLRSGGAFSIPAALAAVALAGRLHDKSRRPGGALPEAEPGRPAFEAGIHFMTQLNGLVHAALEAEDMPTLLQVLTGRARGLFSADECIVCLWEEHPESVPSITAYRSAGQPLTIRPGQQDESTFTGTILDAGRVIPIEDIGRSPKTNPEGREVFPHLRSVLGLPLIAGAQKLGALILGFGETHHFRPEESDRAELAARQISLAMTKVLLLKDARNRVRELAGLHMLSQVFTVHNDDRQTYNLLTKIMASLMESKICFISLIDPGSQELRTQTPAFGLSDELAAAFHFPAELGLQAVRDANTKIFSIGSPTDIPAEFVPLAHSLGIESVLVAPFQDQDGQWLGAVFAANKPGRFSDDDIRMMEAFSSQVAVVIQNTRLLSAERKRAEELAVLHAVAVATTDTDTEDGLIERVTNLIGEKLYPESFDTFLLDEAALELYLHTSYHQGAASDELRIPLGIGITGAVARTGKPRRVEDVTKTPEYLSFYALTRSELCVPLKVENQIIGVVNAESKLINSFSEEDEELLTILAGQIASAIQRLRTVRAEHRKGTQLERSNAMIRALAELGARAASAADPDGVMQTLGSELTSLGMRCLIALTDADNKLAVIRYTSLPGDAMKVIERMTAQKLTDSAIPVERVAMYSNPAQKPSLIGEPISLVLNLMPSLSRQSAMKILKAIGVIETTSVCHLPLVIEGKPIGFLWMWGEGLRDNDLPTMSLFASQVATALQNAKLLAEVQRLAITDDLTGLFNRRHFYDLAEIEFNRAKRYSHPLTALIADIDHFKQFNDRYGHLIGDRVLHEVARMLQESLRDSDILGRYGGEEFSVLLSMTDMKAAVFVAERLLKHVAETPVETDAGELHVQLSVGVAAFSKETPTLYSLINRADQAMYSAKEAGRNRVGVK